MLRVASVIRSVDAGCLQVRVLLGIPISDTGVEDKSRLAVFVLAL